MRAFFCAFCLAFAVLLSAAEKNVDWSRAQELAPGILLTRLELDEPRLMKGAAVRVDLKTPDLQFHVTGKDPQWGEKMPDAQDFIIRTRRQTTRDFLLNFEKTHPDRDMIVAVNAAPWVPWRRPFTHRYADRLGFLVSSGVTVCAADGRFPSFVIWKDGHMEFRHFPADFPVDDILHAVSGFCIVLKDGKALSDAKELHPRTAYGLSADFRYFYILVIDGRQKGYSLGADYRDLAALLLSLGASDGINMDGGGSTTLITHEPGNPSRKALKRQNHYSGERSVGANLGISLKKGSRK